MPISYINFTPPAGQDDNMGGLTQRVYFAPIADFAIIQKPVANPTTFEAKSEILTAHTFAVGKGFATAYCTMDKGKFDAKSQGDTDGKSFKLEGEFFYPGSKSKAHGLASAAKNDNFIILVEMPDSDVEGHIQVGSEMFQAKIEPEFTAAQNSSGVRGYVFKYHSVTPTVCVYKAAITTL